ncbi:alpha/beta hydrolase [Microbacterium sp. SORGH_AS_0888]|uniref:alpha/beta hydrolase n=1 Tax=Microbacterium sp. SORGH_AS_0888 TaxID=3041791 RepID=UPI0027D7E6AA|nr:alpha/beta fold hydrolase [Microbacterium sp. SORGH_AS_0888]
MPWTAARFRSGDGECDASIFRPAAAEDGGPLPIIVLAHGLSGVKSLRLDVYAERFAQRGYVAMTFDYRHFGASTGEPRDFVDIPEQLEDWRSAVAFARTLEGVDPERVILWGTSFGGGHVMTTAADDHRIAAVLAQCPFSDGEATGRATPKKTAQGLARLALRDRAAKLFGRRPVRVPVVGNPGDVAIMTAPGSFEGFRAIYEAAGVPFEIPEIPARVMLQVRNYRPGLRAADVTAPLLISLCERDTVTPAAATEELARRAPRGEIKRFDSGHFGIYVGDLFESVIAGQIEFIERHVPIGTAAPR